MSLHPNVHMPDDPQTTDLLICQRALRELTEVMAVHYHWWHNGRPQLEQYPWPIPGSRDAAHEGEQAFEQYEDYLFTLVAEAEGFGTAHAECVALVETMRSRSPEAVEQLMSVHAQPDDHFLAQWANLHERPEWSRGSHQALVRYARKYETVLPLAALHWCLEVEKDATFDPGLQKYRDHSGALKKGVLIDTIAARLKPLPALQAVFAQAYSPRLRSAIQHNDYTLVGDGIQMLRTGERVTWEDLWSRMRALIWIQNVMLWTMRRWQRPAAPLPGGCGVMSLGWRRAADGAGPILTVLQLVPFWGHHPDASWATHVRCERRGDELHTWVGDARARIGKLTRDLHGQMLEACRRGTIEVEILAIHPCLHITGAAHEAWPLGDGAYCTVAASLSRLVPLAFSDQAPTDGGEPSPSATRPATP